MWQYQVRFLPILLLSFACLTCPVPQHGQKELIGCRSEPCPAVWTEDVIKIIVPKLGRQNAALMQDIQRGLFKDTRTLDVPMWKCESEFGVSGFINALLLYLYLMKHHQKVIHIWRCKMNYGCFLYLGRIALKSFWGYVYSARPCSQCWTAFTHMLEWYHVREEDLWLISSFKTIF